MYRSDRLGQKSNILIRRSQDLSINISNERITNRTRILLSFKRFEKLRPIFMNTKFNEDELEVDKWDIKSTN